MAKVRVSALAKDVGVTSKVPLERLNGMGEYVKSASSTVEAPVVRRYQEKFPADRPAPAQSAPKPTGKAPASPAAPASSDVAATAPSSAPSATPGPKAPATPAASAPRWSPHTDRPHRRPRRRRQPPHRHHTLRQPRPAARSGRAGYRSPAHPRPLPHRGHGVPDASAPEHDARRPRARDGNAPVGPPESGSR